MADAVLIWALLMTIAEAVTLYYAYKYRKQVDNEYLMTRDEDGQFKVLNRGENE